MIKTTALIIEPSDRTKDGNIKAEVFNALCEADIVIDGNRVVKNNPPQPTKPQHPVVINNCSDDT